MPECLSLYPRQPSLVDEPSPDLCQSQMNLKALTDANGSPCFVDPSEVVGLQQCASIGRYTWIERRGRDSLKVRGTPREVAAALSAPEEALKRSAVVDALTHEYRMALGSAEDAPDTRTYFYGSRVVIRHLAERLDVVLDERLVNTPLPEGE